MPPGLQKASVARAVQSGKETPCIVAVAQEAHKNHPLLNHPLWLVVGSHLALRPKPAHHERRVQADILDRGPHNRQAAVLGGEDVNLIGALPHIALRGFRWHWWSEYVGA
jgi:hypothetical protein